MRRRILIAVLTLGTIGGYGSGLVHMRHAHQRWMAMRAMHDGDACCHHGRGAARGGDGPSGLDGPSVENGE